MEKRVLLVISAPGGGGAEESMSHLKTALREQNVSTTLMSINKSHFSMEGYHHADIVIGRDPESRLFGTLLSLIKFILTIVRLNPSFVVLNCELSETYGAFLPLRKAKLVVVEHANPSWVGRTKIGWLVRRILNSRRATFIAVSPHITPPYKGNKYSAVIPNSFLFQDATIKTLVDKISRLVYIGRLSAIHKNPSALISISNSLDLPVVFIGVGEERDTLRELAESTGVTATFTGWTSDPFKLLLPGDLLVVPSDREGDGLVVVQAIAYKVPLLLQDNIDLRKFDLPDKHYCKGVSGFIDSINTYRNSISSLVPSDLESLRIRNERDPRHVAKLWMDFLGIKTIR